MKKLIIILALISLALSSCLKNEQDLFEKSASERVREVQEGTEKVLNEAPNGWLVEYYPSKYQTYGGVTIFMKFTKGSVAVTSEVGGPDVVKSSLYSYDQDSGPTLNFDTYNPLFHIYSDPGSGVGPDGMGMGGDSEFVIMSYASDKVVLRGKKTGNAIIMTPLPAGSWSTMFKSYSDAVEKMDAMASYQMVIKGKTFEVVRTVEPNYASRYFTIIAADGQQINAPFMYTTKGLKFYKPIAIGGTVIADMEWKDDMFVNSALGVTVMSIASDNKFIIAVDAITDSGAVVDVTPTIATENYYFDVYPVGFEASYPTDAAIMAKLLGDAKPSWLSMGPDKGDFSGYLLADTDYIVVAFGVGVSSSGAMYPTTKLTRQTFRTTKGATSSAAYEAWLGTWTVTSASSAISKTPIVFDVTFDTKQVNKTYSVLGWSVSALRAGTTTTATLNEVNGAFTVQNDQQIAETTQGVLKYTSSCLASDGGTYLVSGNYSGLTGTLTSATSANVVGAALNLSGGMTAQVLSMDFVMNATDGKLYTYNPAPGFVIDDDPIGPYTMTKKAAASNLGGQASGLSTLRHLMAPNVEKFDSSLIAKEGKIFQATVAAIFN